MIGLLTTFLAGPYGLLLKIGAVIAIVAGIWLHGRHAGVESMVPRLEAAKSDAELWQKTAGNRLKLIQAQNDAVEGLKHAQETKLALMKDKVAKAEREAVSWRKQAEQRANDMLGLELSKDECTALKQLVDEARK
jgi:hypothetical protein